jgi:flavin-dependent dehydrogenase
MRKIGGYHQFLADGDTVAVIGGGPAGAFSALRLLQQAQARGKCIRAVIFEPSCKPSDNSTASLSGHYVGCPQCAGGISPKLYDALINLGIELQPEVIQADIGSITVQGKWKSITIPVPRARKMYSVYRGTLPYGQHHSHCFDAMLLGSAVSSGAELIGARVEGINYRSDGGLILDYQAHGMPAQLSADFAIFAGGVNQGINKHGGAPTLMELFRRLQPAFRPPRTRQALIFELEAPGAGSEALQGELHFIESSAAQLQLDMCSILSKRGYITVTLVGRSVDRANSHQQNLQVIRAFLELGRIRMLLPPQSERNIRCICNPRLVVGTANRPFGDRIAVVGDMATSRQYKDGILSAHNMAESLIATLFKEGIDEHSLAVGYAPTITQFKRDNQYATLIFLLYRWFFTNPFLSRVIYQTFASEKKAKPEKLRSFKRIFWNISSGDSSYRDIAWSMLRPSTLWLILWGGVYTTLRNGLCEWFFGLDWRGIRRVPTVVSRRELKAKRMRLLPDATRNTLRGRLPEFECMYTIHIRENSDIAMALLAQFGEADRPYLNPRWVGIKRTSGAPLQEGSIIEYSIFGRLISFSIELQESDGDNFLVYQVRDGFAHDGVFLFEVQQTANGHCELTIYLAFDYARGNSLSERLFWRLFRLLFPEFIHDVLWNHALCELKHRAEATVTE